MPQAADERYNAELLRERDAHQQAINRLESNAEESVTNQLQFALHTREYGLLVDKKLNEANMCSTKAEGHQLYVQLQYALYEVNALRAELSSAADAPVSDAPAIP